MGRFFGTFWVGTFLEGWFVRVGFRTSSRGRFSSLALVGGCLAALGLLFLGPVRGWGDEILMVDGLKITGSVIEETPEYVRFRMTKGAVVRLPRNRIKSLSIKKVSQSEAAGDLAMTRKSFYEAKILYESALKEESKSDLLEEKLKKVMELIEEEENISFERSFEAARGASASGKHDEAIEKFKGIVEGAPREGAYWPKARRALAYEYLLKSYQLRDRIEYEKSINAMRLAVQTEPDLPIVRLELADLMSKFSNDEISVLEEYERGIASGRKYLALDAKERDRFQFLEPPEARFDEARLNLYRYDMTVLKYGLGRKLEAAQDFLDLVEEEAFSQFRTDKIITYIIEAYTDPNIGQRLDPEMVQRKLDIALKLRPRTAKAWMLKGQIYLRGEEAQRAIDSFTSATLYDPNIAELHRYRAKAYLLADQIDLARRDLEFEVNLHPTYVTICELGQVRLLLADVEGALREFNRAVRMDLEGFPGLVGRARAYRLKIAEARNSIAVRLDMLRTAEKDVDTVLKNAPQNLDAVLEKGHVILDRGRLMAKASYGDALTQYAAASKYFGEVIDKLKSREDSLSKPEKILLAESFTERGLVNLSLGNNNRAQQDLVEALMIRPNFALAYSRLGEVSEVKMDFEDARDFYKKAIDLEPENADFEMRLALLYHTKIKDYKAAIVHYNLFQSKEGYSPQLNHWIQECRNALGTNK